MTNIQLVCSRCKKGFLRDLRHVNENKKLGQKPFCSLTRLGDSRRKRVKLTYDNSLCNKEFSRALGSLSSHNFCSKSCAAKTSNAKRGKLVKRCANLACTEKFSGKRKYCSFICIPKNKSKYTKETIIIEIRTFTDKHGRIPTKRDLEDVCKMARRHFKTWNKAIKAAGFKPNPVMFATKHIAQDVHKCDSLAEKIIDDWLYKRNVPHRRTVAYPSNPTLSVDFLVEDYWIEFFGLAGQHKRYDELKEEKLQIAQKYNLKLIEIYPFHLFPKNMLPKILAVLK